MSLVNIFYHSADLDGHTSGAIARNYYEGNYEINMHPINYGDTFPWDCLNDDGLKIVVMLDFSLVIEDMIKLSNMCNRKNIDFIWIDHHIGVIKLYNENIDKFGHNISGRREPSGCAACKLAWKYFYTGEHTPYIIDLISIFDIWDHTDLDEWNEEIEPFHYGMSCIETDPSTRVGWNNWKHIFRQKTSTSRAFESKMIEDGKSITDYLKVHFARDIKNRAIKIDWFGYKCLVLNGDYNAASYITMSEEFKDCQVGVVYNRGNKGSWSVSLRSLDNGPDVQKIAYACGGNGHAHASGFEWKDRKLPWEEE